MRTTIHLNDDLLRQVKQLAIGTGRTMTATIEDALREALARGKQAKHAEPVELLTVGGNGLQPGVDLDDSAALLDLMNDANDSH